MLGKNQLTHIDQDLIVNSLELQELWLNGNKLRKIIINVAKLPRIMIIDLSHNFCIDKYFHKDSCQAVKDIHEFQSLIERDCA